MLVRIITFLCLFLTPMLGHSLDLTLEESGIVKRFPSCFIPIVKSRDAIWENNFLFAATLLDENNNPTMYIDPEAFSEAPPEFQVWVSRHECYHHVASVRGKAYGFHPAFHPADERQADRWATKQVVNYDFTDTQLKLIYDTIKDVDLYKRNESIAAKAIREARGGDLAEELNKRAEAFKLDVMVYRALKTKYYGSPW